MQKLRLTNVLTHPGGFIIGRRELGAFLPSTARGTFSLAPRGVARRDEPSALGMSVYRTDGIWGI